MKVFAKFQGEDDILQEGFVYLIDIYNRVGDLQKLNVKIGDGEWWKPYANYFQLTREWEIL